MDRSRSRNRLSDLVKRELVDRKDAVARAVHVEELARLMGSLG